MYHLEKYVLGSKNFPLRKRNLLRSFPIFFLYSSVKKEASIMAKRDHGMQSDVPRHWPQLKQEINLFFPRQHKIGVWFVYHFLVDDGDDHLHNFEEKNGCKTKQPSSINQIIGGNIKFTISMHLKGIEILTVYFWRLEEFVVLFDFFSSFYLTISDRFWTSKVSFRTGKGWAVVPSRQFAAIAVYLFPSFSSTLWSLIADNKRQQLRYFIWIFSLLSIFCKILVEKKKIL